MNKIRRMFLKIMAALPLAPSLAASAPGDGVRFEVIHNADAFMCGGVAVWAVSRPQLGEVAWHRHFRSAGGQAVVLGERILCHQCRKPFNLMSAEFRELRRG